MVHSTGRVLHLNSVGSAVCVEGRFAGLAEVRGAMVMVGDVMEFAFGPCFAAFAVSALRFTRWRSGGQASLASQDMLKE